MWLLIVVDIRCTDVAAVVVVGVGVESVVAVCFRWCCVFVVSCCWWCFVVVVVVVFVVVNWGKREAPFQFQIEVPTLP